MTNYEGFFANRASAEAFAAKNNLHVKLVVPQIRGIWASLSAA